jgi:hypothetical protein
MMPRHVPRLHRMQNAHCFLSFVKVNCFAVDQIEQRGVALSTTGSDARVFDEDTSSLSSLPSSRGRRATMRRRRCVTWCARSRSKRSTRWRRSKRARRCRRNSTLPLACPSVTARGREDGSKHFVYYETVVAVDLTRLELNRVVEVSRSFDRRLSIRR